MNNIKNSIREHKGFIILVFLGCIFLVVLWKLFYFLTDDAFIAFRYVSNSIKGHGYVWNSAPFAPVEGYTSFLWVFILEVVWRLFNIKPPISANYISLFFSLLTLILSSFMVFKLSWSPRLKKMRIFIITVFIILLLSNRTFLTWTSSGLETAMFGFFVLLWVFVYSSSSSLWQKIFFGHLVSTLIALTRPDGLLFVAGTILISIYLIVKENLMVKDLKKLLLGFSPLIILLGHFIYRVSYYGEWLPNTYYAKVSSIWPKSGLIYFFSFLWEYGLWLVLLIIIIYGFKFIFTRSNRKDGSRQKLKYLITEHFIMTVVGLILIGHFIYYTFFIGGDFFEYRVYNHFLPLILILLVGMLNQLKFKVLPSIALLLGFLFISLPIQWSHWLLAKKVDMKTNRRQNHFVPISPKWPKALRWYAQLFDNSQRWLIPHYVCRRYHSHKSFWLYLESIYPDRTEGDRISNQGYPVYLAKNVGVPAWVLPNVNIIDTLGLNDYVIARIPLPKNAVRRMAHDRYRVGPDEYIKNFHPNIRINKKKVVVKERKIPFSSIDIINNESKWKGYLKNLGKPLRNITTTQSQIDSGHLKLKADRIRDIHQYWYLTVDGKWKKIELMMDNLFQLLSSKTIDQYFNNHPNKRIRSKITHPSFEAVLLRDLKGKLPGLSINSGEKKVRFVFTLMKFKIDFERGEINKDILYCMPYQGKVVVIEF